MNTDNQQPYISDASKPNAGRIYDYFLGGNHNFKIDREMAKQILKVAPFAPTGAKVVRWFLGEAIRQNLKLGFTCFLDFASGLPTVDHIHSTAPEGTKVIYSDIDPITVKYGRKIIGENPFVRYEICNAANPENLLKSNIIESLFGDNRKIAIGFNGVCWFLSDEQINHAMTILYEWADKGATLFLTDYDSDNMTEGLQSFINLYKSMNQFMGIRSKKKFIELIKPWKLEEPGFLPLEKWIKMSPEITEDTIKTFGGGGPFGGFLTK